MRAVLSTLQPDQYEAVSARPDELLVVQGGPGTGKSIIATHRAAYLTSSAPERPAFFDEVLILGPTRHYLNHVRPTLSELGVLDRVRLYSVEQLVERYSNHQHPPPAQHSDPRDVSWDLAFVAKRTARMFPPHRLPSQKTKRNLKTVVNVLAKDPAVRAKACLGLGPEIESWLKDMRDYSHARQNPRYALFFAVLSLCLERSTQSFAFPHVIVDEAQDLRSLDWMLVDAVAGGTLTLLGDLNQRRSDHTPPSWEAVVERLELVDDIEAFEPVQLNRSYRTTRQILRFAGRLLPRGHRNLPSLMSGSEPDLFGMESSTPIEAAQTAIRRIQWALNEHDAASAAIVSSDVAVVNSVLRSFGFARRALDLPYVNSGQEIYVLSSDEARGLEFDVVAVHEPGGFPENLGRHGALFTALTRASKHLILTGSLPLPKELGG